MSNIQEAIELLEKVDLRSDYAVGELRNIISTKLRRLPIFMTDLKIGEPIIRARYLEESDQFHRLIQDYSYNPDPQKIKFGRANLPIQQIFYGARYRVTALGEVKFIYANRAKDFAYYSFGRWEAVKKLNLAAIVTPEELRKHKSKELLGLATFIEETTEQYKSDPELGGLNDVYRYMSEKFRQPVQEGEEFKYKITAVFSNFIYSKLSIAHGILYQSVQYPENFNIALKKETVDSDMVKLTFAAKQKFERTGHLEYKEIESIQAASIDYQKKIVNWP